MESLNETCSVYKMELRTEKTKLMTNSENGIKKEIKVNEQKLGTVKSLKNIGTGVSDDGSKPKFS